MILEFLILSSVNSWIFFRYSELDIFMTDLVSSISFSLRREVPKMRVINGEALHALKDWVSLLLQVNSTPVRVKFPKACYSSVNMELFVFVILQ